MKSVISTIVLSLFFCLDVQAGGTPESVDTAGRQRMLTQKISKDVLRIALGVNDKATIQSLRQGHALFDASLNHLIEGNQRLGISKAPVKLVHQLIDIQHLWEPTSSSIQQVIDEGKVKKEQLEFILVNSSKLLALSHQFTTDLAAGNEVNEEQSRLLQRVNLAGKLRMLSQKIAVQALAVCYHYAFFEHKNLAINTINEFDNIVDGLLFGNAYLQLSKVQRGGELALLKTLQAQWSTYINTLTPLLQIEFSVCDKTVINRIEQNSVSVLSTANRVVQQIK